MIPPIRQVTFLSVVVPTYSSANSAGPAREQHTLSAGRGSIFVPRFPASRRAVSLCRPSRQRDVSRDATQPGAAASRTTSPRAATAQQPRRHSAGTRARERGPGSDPAAPAPFCAGSRGARGARGPSPLRHTHGGVTRLQRVSTPPRFDALGIWHGPRHRGAAKPRLAAQPGRMYVPVRCGGAAR